MRALTFDAAARLSSSWPARSITCSMSSRSAALLATSTCSPTCSCICNSSFCRRWRSAVAASKAAFRSTACNAAAVQRQAQINRTSKRIVHVNSKTHKITAIFNTKSIVGTCSALE